MLLDSLSPQRLPQPSVGLLSTMTKTSLQMRSVWVAAMGLCLVGVTACESVPTSPQATTSATTGMVATPTKNSTVISQSTTQQVQQTQITTPQTIVISTVPGQDVPFEPMTQTVPTVIESPSLQTQDNPLTTSPDYNEGYSTHESPFGIPEITNPPKIPTYHPPSASLPPVPVINTPTQPTQSARDALLERARQNSQSGFETKPTTASNGDNLPAFRKLMENGIADLKANRLTAAESKFTRAQRLAPRSSAVYFYLSQVALKKNQPKKAEAMARRGLVVAEDSNRRRALWQLILRSGQMQNNSRVVSEASKALR